MMRLAMEVRQAGFDLFLVNQLCWTRIWVIGNYPYGKIKHKDNAIASFDITSYKLNDKKK